MKVLSTEEVVTAVTESLINMAAIMAPIMEAMSGYKAQLQDQGFSESTAEQMCVEYHKLIIDRIRG